MEGTTLPQRSSDETDGNKELGQRVTEHSDSRENVTDQQAEDRPEAEQAMGVDEEVSVNKTTDAREQPRRRPTPEGTVGGTKKCATMDWENGKDEIEAAEIDCASLDPEEEMQTEEVRNNPIRTKKMKSERSGEQQHVPKRSSNRMTLSKKDKQ